MPSSSWTAWVGIRPAASCAYRPTSPRSACHPTRRSLRGSAPQPVDNVWAYLRSNKLANRVYETYDDILDACTEAWNWFTSQPERITAIASRPWAQVTQ